MNTQMLAVVSGQTIVDAVIWLVVAGLIYWVLTWGVAKIAPPEPFAKIINVLLILAVVVFIINAILTLAGHPYITYR